MHGAEKSRVAVFYVVVDFHFHVVDAGLPEVVLVHEPEGWVGFVFWEGGGGRGGQEEKIEKFHFFSFFV